MKHFLEPSKEIPIIGEYDVIVCGGGPAGICAGLASARQGLKTILIEQFNCLGGIATAGLHQKIAVYCGSGGHPEIAGGLAAEIRDRSVKDGGAQYLKEQKIYSRAALFVDIENYKYLLDSMAKEAGLELLYYSQFADVIAKENKIEGIVVTSKSGRHVIMAKTFIDCTGDADMAFRAGCPVQIGRPEDGKMQPVTLMYRVGGVDANKIWRYREEQDAVLEEFCKKAVEKGLMGPWQSKLMGFWWNENRPDHMNVNFSHMHYDGTSVFDLTKAAIEGRQQVQEAVHAMRELIPGFENSFLIDTASYIGVRETRRIQGEFILTVDDLKSQKIFDDSIGLGGAFIDIHNVEGPGMDKKAGFVFPEGGYYSIPYRTLVPQGIDNLLVAGRCHSSTHEAAGSTRWMTQCMIMGEAAGMAAKLSIENQCSMKSVDIKLLKQRLISNGAILA